MTFLHEPLYVIQSHFKVVENRTEKRVLQFNFQMFVFFSHVPHRAFSTRLFDENL